MAWQQQYPPSSSPLPTRRVINHDEQQPYVEMKTIGTLPSATSNKPRSGGQSPSRMDQSPQAYASARLVYDEKGSHILSSCGSGDPEYCPRPGCYEKDMKINTLTRQLELCHDESKNLRTMLVEKKHELGSMQQRITELEAENAKLKQARESLEIASIQHDQAHLQILQRQVDLLQKRNQELAMELTRVKDQSPDQQEVGQLRSQKDKLQQEVQYLSGQLQRKTNVDPRELEMYRIECRDLRAEVEILRQQVLTYTEDFHTERADRQRAQAALHRLEEERDNLQQTIAVLTQDTTRARR